jgi:NAD-dependent SIR2 family protein deacetylase
MAGLMIEINPDETPLSRTATRSVREPATVAVPKIIDELLDINAGPSERPK